MAAKGKGRWLTIALLKSKCKVDPKSGCWNFVGDPSQRYPRIGHDGVCTKAHVAAFVLKSGRWPRRGRLVMHSCDNTRCANPEHVSEGTPKQNHRDAMAKGRLHWKLSDETRRRQSLASIGRKFSAETRRKLSSYVRTPETRAKMSTSAKARWERINANG